MPMISHECKLIHYGDYTFSIDFNDAYFHIPTVKHYHDFLQFVWQNIPYQWKVLPFGLATATMVFTGLIRFILFLC